LRFRDVPPEDEVLPPPDGLLDVPPCPQAARIRDSMTSGTINLKRRRILFSFDYLDVC
jgi:hypothetical protein